MVNFLGASRNRKLRSVISNVSNDSVASLDANPNKELRSNQAPRKQITSPRQRTERNTNNKNTFSTKQDGRDPPPKRNPSGARRNTSQIPFDSRTPLHDTPKANSRSDAKNNHPREGPPVCSPRSKPQIETSFQYEVIDLPLSPKSENVVTSPRGILKTGSNKDSPKAVLPASNSLQRENEPVYLPTKKGFDDEALGGLMSGQTAKAKTKKKKGLFSRFGGGRRDKDDRSTSDSAISAPKEVVHEIITNDIRRVSMSPFVVTLGEPEVETKVEPPNINMEKTLKKTSGNNSATKSPQHDRGTDKGIASFVDNLASFARIPASTLSRSAKKHGSFLLEVFHSEPTAAVSPRATTTTKQKKSAMIPTELPVNSRAPETPRQRLSPIDPTRQQDWIVSVIEAIHRARRMPARRDGGDNDYESMIDSEDSDILDGPRVVYMTSGDLDDASVSSIEVLFHWMTCTMDRVYPNKDHRSYQVVADDFSLMEDESTEGSLEED